MTAKEVDRRSRFTQLQRDVAERTASVVLMADTLLAAGLSTSVGHRAGPYAGLGRAIDGLRAAEKALSDFCSAEQTVLKEGE